MSKKYANVVVHVSGPIRPAERAGIEQAIAAESGVARAVTSAKTGRLILVDYDPVIISARRILDTARGRGVSAQLVGM
jgi:sensor domain CHASE-containing protein